LPAGELRCIWKGVGYKKEKPPPEEE